MRTSVALAILLLIVALAGVFLLRQYVMQTDRDSDASGVPLYLGSDRMTTLNIDRTSSKELVMAIRERYSISEEKAIVMFGVTTCPYCKSQHDVLSKSSPAKYVPIWIDRDEQGRELFFKLIEAETTAGARLEQVNGVPHTIVLKGESIVAIVIGRVAEVGFWSQLVR